eukprot:359499-Chlamydomonas_euryale.AAC.3
MLPPHPADHVRLTRPAGRNVVCALDTKSRLGAGVGWGPKTLDTKFRRGLFHPGSYAASAPRPDCTLLHAFAQRQ